MRNQLPQCLFRVAEIKYGNESIQFSCTNVHGLGSTASVKNREKPAAEALALYSLEKIAVFLVWECPLFSRIRNTVFYLHSHIGSSSLLNNFSFLDRYCHREIS